MNILEAAYELVDAIVAAGLDCRFVADPDRGAGVVVDMPSWDFGSLPKRSGCADLTPAVLEATVTLVGAGWATEQILQYGQDIDAVRAAVPPPWTPDRGSPEFSPDAPLYRIICTR